MERTNMENVVPQETSGGNAERHVPRRALPQMALAVTASGGFQAMAWADARTATSERGAVVASRESSPAIRSGTDSPMKDAIEACLDCHAMCVRMAMGYCLERGGGHVEPRHIRLMLNCAELCQTSANFMLSDSPLHGQVCAVCAEACEACAKSCEEIGDMRECAEECRSCARSCRSMT